MGFGLGSRRLRLRARLTLAFGLGALLLSVMLSVVTYGLVRTNLIDSREESARSVAVVNADQASRRITDETDEDAVRDAVGEPAHRCRRCAGPTSRQRLGVGQPGGI